MENMSPGPQETPSREFTQGFRWEGESLEELVEIVEAAFDYRGDVRLIFRTGAEVTGYISNRDRSVERPFIDLFPADGSSKQRILYAEIRGVAFSGKDTASGRSWETWAAKWQAKKDAEARGERVGDVGLYPEPLG